MKDGPFENVKYQVGCCGVWCGSCVAGNGALRELTLRYEGAVDLYDLETWAPQDFDFKEFKKGLASIRKMPLCQGCLAGDGRSHCEIRACVKKKNLGDCSQCHEINKCNHREQLEEIRMGAIQAGFIVKTKDVDWRELIQEWIETLKKRWPALILFLNED